jgi:hypothetical protein
MHYICVENDQVISVLNYQPTVPNTVIVIELSDSEYSLIENKTHYFNVETKSVAPLTPEQLSQQQTFNENTEKIEFLNSTDWKVLRHIREKALGIATSMTEAEYLILENQRNEVAKSITQ